MEQKDKISIIVPCYNAEKYLKKCLDSIINQTYNNIEIITINDGSKDNTLKILKDYEKRDYRIIVINKENTGVSDSRNIGIKMATGKYVMFADADDYFELNAVETLYNALVKNKSNIVRGKWRRQLKSTNYIEDSIEKYNSMDKGNIIENILSGNISCYVWLLIIKAEVLRKYNIMFSPELKMMEDTYFYIQLLEKENIFFLDKVVYNYVENEKSASRNIKNTKNIYIEMLKAEKYIINTLKKNNYWNNKLRDTAIKKIIINGICNSTWNLYKAKEEKLFLDFIKYIDKNENIQSIFAFMNIKKVRLDKKIAINLIRKKRYKKLYFFYKIKYIIYSLKKRRKNEQ